MIRYMIFLIAICGSSHAQVSTKMSERIAHKVVESFVNRENRFVDIKHNTNKGETTSFYLHDSILAIPVKNILVKLSRWYYNDHLYDYDSVSIHQATILNSQNKSSTNQKQAYRHYFKGNQEEFKSKSSFNDIQITIIQPFFYSGYYYCVLSGVYKDEPNYKFRIMYLLDKKIRIIDRGYF